jgi:DNA-binding MarR family transcriptional regulator
MRSLAHELHLLVALMDRRADGLLQRSGCELSYARFLVVLHVSEGDRMTQRDLSDRLGTSEAAVSRMVAGLARDGYVDVARGRGNRRSLSLTERGGSALAAAAEALGDGVDRLVRSTGTDPAVMAASVRAVITALQQHPADTVLAEV